MCNDLTHILLNNIKYIKKKEYKFRDFKNILITYLIINFKSFKKVNKYAKEYFIENKFPFNLKENRIKTVFNSYFT